MQHLNLLQQANTDAASKKEKIALLESKLGQQKEKLSETNKKANSLERNVKEKVSWVVM